VVIAVELVNITIRDRVRWHERLSWIQLNSLDFHDATDWASWQIGLSDIHLAVDSGTALVYYLTWTEYES
jgi:hypothetical protein